MYKIQTMFQIMLLKKNNQKNKLSLRNKINNQVLLNLENLKNDKSNFINYIQNNKYTINMNISFSNAINTKDFVYGYLYDP